MARIAPGSGKSQRVCLDGLPAALARFDPRTCLLCGARGAFSGSLCGACSAELPRAGGGDRTLLQHRDALDAVHASFVYGFPLDGLLQRWKYQGDLASGQALIRLFRDDVLQQVCAAPELLLPVPLHWWKLMRRGFNQAALLAAPLGRALGCTVGVRQASRAWRRAQSRSSAATRAANMQRAFKLHCLPPRHVVIVDDVLTTGATANALAAVLKRAGAQRVDVWALAQTPIDR